MSLLVVGSALFYPRTFSSSLKKFCRIVCADLPHFVPPGANFKPGSISFELYANCIEAIRSAAGLEQVVIVGHSHHGNIALEYAKRYPDKVSHVVLIGTPPADISLRLSVAANSTGRCMPLRTEKPCFTSAARQWLPGTWIR